MTITVPIPHKSLSPNARSHWATKSRHAKAARERAWATTLSALNGATWNHDGHVLIKPVFYWPTRHARDLDNASAMLKNTRDGIAEALGVNDSLFVPWPAVMDYDKDNPRVEITIEGATP